MKINGKTGLVLEGGGMRGVFTSGVLDAFMKHDLYFRYIVAVSAGACNGMSYVSRQPRRARISNIDYLARYKYIGIRHLVTQGCIFDRELLYDKFPNQLLPFDFDEYFKHAKGFEMVTTNCLTGKAMYLSETSDRQRSLDIVRASSSLPYVSKIVTVDGIPMLDGGIIDSIPINRAIETGHEHNVVILTRNKDWRDTGKDRKVPAFIYKNYPRLRVVLSHRHVVYNQQIDLIDRLEAEGKITCIRPMRPMEVGRIENDVEKLERLYEEGFAIGEKFAVENG
ncbi:patatin family protein [Prevotella sp. HMSC077E09]|uniref:patatin-like phospholipase family protein n=1 Tax=Prevotella sp. HMSC077E09 TaxID=1739487 RepID=UPI0008A4AEAE|nr:MULTISPECIES: patatin family protein [unclassified Prevotella]OFO76941.1 patatin family protein [Prevotella sp. HMSC077E08]OFP56076.1 patatin family protein [Prevotella sp. HMSC077E09]